MIKNNERIFDGLRKTSFGINIIHNIINDSKLINNNKKLIIPNLIDEYLENSNNLDCDEDEVANNCEINPWKDYFYFCDGKINKSKKEIIYITA